MLTWSFWELFAAAVLALLALYGGTALLFERVTRPRPRSHALDRARLDLVTRLGGRK